MDHHFRRLRRKGLGERPETAIDQGRALKALLVGTIGGAIIGLAALLTCYLTELVSLSGQNSLAFAAIGAYSLSTILGAIVEASSTKTE